MIHETLPSVALRRNLLNTFSMKIYGEQLLTQSTNSWIGIARIFVALIATVEAITWAYVGSILGADSPVRALFVAGIGISVFLLVWFLDASIITFDVSGSRSKKGQGAGLDADSGIAQSIDAVSEHDAPESKSQGSHGIMKTLWYALRSRSGRRVLTAAWAFWKYPLLPFGSRLIIVAASVLVTAPYVSMYFLEADINKEFEISAQRSLADAKQVLVGKIAKETQIRGTKLKEGKAAVTLAYTAWKTAFNQYVCETDGTCGTRIPKEGPAAKAKLRFAEELKLEYEMASDHVLAMEKEYRTTGAPTEKELIIFQTAAIEGDYEKLTALFLVPKVNKSLSERIRIANALMSSKPEYKRIEYSCYSFLIILVIALMLQKYLAPKGVKIYYSERRQSQWHEYRRGQYDSLLEPRYRSSTIKHEDISPLAFIDLWDEIIEPTLKRLKDDEISESIRHIVHECEPLRHALMATQDEARSIKNEIADLVNRQNAVSADLKAQVEKKNERVQALIESERNLGDIVSGAAPLSADLIQRMHIRLAKDRQAIVDSQLKIDGCEAERGKIEMAVSRLKNELVDKERIVVQLQAQLEPLDDLLSQQRQEQIDCLRAGIGRVSKPSVHFWNEKSQNRRKGT